MSRTAATPPGAGSARTRSPIPAPHSLLRVGVALGLLVAVTVWLGVVRFAEPFIWGTLGPGHDARPYWEAALAHPYAHAALGDFGAYLYSPAFLQVLSPLRGLPWPAFLGAWEAILIVSAGVLSGPVLLGPLLVAVVPELWGGNVTLILALAVVVGFRWPAAWSFVLLTKVTPGIGLLWFAVRREWHPLAIALVTTAAIAAVSFMLAPDAWREWIAILLDSVGRPVTSGSFPVPFAVRLPIAVVVVAWGALTDRRWVVPVACLVALPVIWYGSLALLAGTVPLVLPRLATRWPIAGAGWRDLRDRRLRARERPATGTNG